MSALEVFSMLYSMIDLYYVWQGLGHAVVNSGSPKPRPRWTAAEIAGGCLVSRRGSESSAIITTQATKSHESYRRDMYVEPFNPSRSHAFGNADPSRPSRHRVGTADSQQ
jgi:hypothetical protein